MVVSIQSLAGATNTPGQLMDRSAMVPAGTIRDMAQQPGTLFYRLLTDEQGNLLDVTEMGRFPSRKLGMAVKFRDGTCTGPTCTKPASDCDLDHLVPAPSGPTTASNLERQMPARSPSQDPRRTPLVTHRGARLQLDHTHRPSLPHGGPTATGRSLAATRSAPGDVR